MDSESRLRDGGHRWVSREGRDVWNMTRGFHEGHWPGSVRVTVGGARGAGEALLLWPSSGGLRRVSCRNAGGVPAAGRDLGLTRHWQWAKGSYSLAERASQEGWAKGHGGVPRAVTEE